MAAELEDEPINEAVSLNIEADNYERLSTYAEVGETLDTTINRIIDGLEECNSKKASKEIMK